LDGFERFAPDELAGPRDGQAVAATPNPEAAVHLPAEKIAHPEPSPRRRKNADAGMLNRAARIVEASPDDANALLQKRGDHRPQPVLLARRDFNIIVEEEHG